MVFVGFQRIEIFVAFFLLFKLVERHLDGGVQRLRIERLDDVTVRLACFGFRDDVIFKMGGEKDERDRVFVMNMVCQFDSVIDLLKRDVK